MEEVDLINRTAKLVLYYCRLQHDHHYALCWATNSVQDRQLNPDLNNEDLDSLLLRTPCDVMMTQLQLPSMNSSDYGISCSTSDQNRIPISTKTAITDVQSNNNPYSIPLGGHVILEVHFPLTYPSGNAVPKFYVLKCNPPLPSELIDELKRVIC